MTSEIKKRDCAVDAVKGVCILCIVLLHFENGFFPPRLNWWIGLFMVPGFYFVSGYLLAHKDKLPDIKEFAQKRFVQLGWPYLTFAVLALIFDGICAMCGWMPWKILLREIYKTLVLHGVGPLWFLPVLFFSECSFVYIATRQYRKTIFFVTLLVSLAVYHLYFSIWLQQYRNLNDIYRMVDAVIAPYASSCWGWVVVSCGYFFGKCLKIKSIPNIWRIGVGCLSILLSVCLMLIPYSVPFLSTLLSNILPIIGMLLVFSVLGMNPILKFFTFWGRNSLLVMCLHFTIFEEAFKIIDSRILNRSEFSGWPSLVYFALTLLCLYFLVPVFNHQLRILISK